MNKELPVLRRDFNLIKDKKVHLKTIKEIKEDLLAFLQNRVVIKGEYDYIESINPNPVGLPTLANLLSCIKGDMVARILNVKPSYYINDAGRNFSKFLLNHRLNKEMPITQIYNLEINSEEELTKVRKEIFTKFPEDAKKLRDDMVTKILSQYQKINVLQPDLIYQSDYSEQVDQLIKNGDHKEDGVYYKNVKIATSTGIPLYIAADYCYHLDKDLKYNKKLQVVSKDHDKYIKTIDSMTGTPWAYTLSPMIVYQEDKLSKRRNHDVTLNQLLKVNFKLTESEVLSCIKLYYMKYERRDKLEVEQLIEELKNPILIKPFKNIADNSTIDYENVISTLEEEDLQEVIRCWGNVKEVLHWAVNRLDVNKIYKFIEHVHIQPKSQKSEIIHKKLLLKLKEVIGL